MNALGGIQWLLLRYEKCANQIQSNLFTNSVRMIDISAYDFLCHLQSHAGINFHASYMNITIRHCALPGSVKTLSPCTENSAVSLRLAHKLSRNLNQHGSVFNSYNNFACIIPQFTHEPNHNCSINDVTMGSRTRKHLKVKK